ncbi:MAG: AAA family ATPase, partial [Bacteroidota bacterium]
MIKPSTFTRPQLSPQATQQLLDRLLPLAETPPVCLWGRHGIGKTTLIKDWAAAKGWPLVMISPAQFEEMGDLLGLPYLQEEGDRKTTVLAPPQWAPQAAGPGVLLLDDFNRADGRIIRGLMNLLLEGQLNSWRLPAGWKIVLTANPEEQEYIVTPLDEAILGRMLHLEVTFSLD